MITNVVKIFLPATIAFVFGIAITPLFSHYFYKYRLWKKVPKGHKEKDPMTEAFTKIHNQKEETSTPRVGGIIIWFSVFITVMLIWIVSMFFPTDSLTKLNFLSRNQTILPFFSLIIASIIGLLDDLLVVYGNGAEEVDGISRKDRILAVIAIGLVGAWWFYVKLGVTSIVIPFVGAVNIGLFFIPVFVIVMLATFSGSIIDGVDGLSGGVMASAFGAYATIAFVHNQVDIAAFCTVIVGAILAFLWFNIPPARFYMGETGMLGLTVTLSIIAFLTNAVLILPIIAFPLVMTSGSVMVQKASERIYGKKFFLVSPLHHHFEARGWSRPKIVMRYWVISIIFAVIGIMLALIS